MNELSLICRIIGNLFYRAPSDEQLAPLYKSIFNGSLMQSWPLQQDELFKRWQKCNQVDLAKEYQRLTTERVINNNFFEYNENIANKDDWKQLVQESNIPVSETTQTEHYGFIWLVISWLEEQRAELEASQPTTDDVNSQATEYDKQIEANELLIHNIFFGYLKPISKTFLGNLEAHTQQDFYRVLAIMTRELIEAIEEELAEIETDENICQ